MNDTENGLIKEKEIDGLVFKAQWMTPELMALNELKKMKVEQVEWKKIYDEYKGMLYCKLTIGDSEGGYVYEDIVVDGISEAEVEEHLNYKAQADIFLISGSDTSACALYSFSKTYGLAKQLDVAVGFENTKNGNKGDYILEMDAAFLKRGLVIFRFNQKDISHIPTLII